MKIGFIGSGNMATAMITGIINNKVVDKADLYASDANEAAVNKIKENFGINATTDNITVAKNSDVLILSVKPQFYKTVISQIKDTVTEKTIIVTIAAGQTLKAVTEMFGRTDLKIIRTMPNTPALVGEGITGLCKNENITEEEMNTVCGIFNSFGKAEVITENMMDAVVAVSGSSPAYVFMFIEAMADAAVAEGMPRAQAYKFAAQAVYGSAKMVLETGKHPAELKDMVCSPAGTTIEAVRVLEEKGFRSSVIEAMKACSDKSRKLG